MKSFTLLICLLSGLAPGLATAEDVERLLKADRPAGVVFEIIGSGPDMLHTALPEMRRDIERLRERFPELPVAVVSHGREQFAFTSDNSNRYSKAHGLVQQLVEQDKVDVHVCGTHASWYDVMPEDFPDYIDVSATGPAQINDYVDLGYELIVID